jgi:hemolysin III
MFPIALILGLIMVATAPSTEAKVVSAIFGASAALLFGVSALLHRGSWSPRVEDVLRRVDHSNIYLIIAGSYTPFAVLALPDDQGRTLLLIVWTGAIAGVLLRVFWTSAPRWLTTMLYVVVGWVAVFYLPGLIEGAGGLAVSLIILGGVLYTIGAIVYATKRPNPSPEWFGFHEVFHTLTISAFAAHYVAVWIVVHA